MRSDNRWWMFSAQALLMQSPSLPSIISSERTEQPTAQPFHWPFSLP